MPVYILLARKFDTRWLMMFGLASFGLSMWGFSYITSDWSGGELLVPQILRGFPQVFAVAPAVTLGLGSLPPERLKYASGLFNMMRNLGGAVGIAVCGAILNARTNFHFNVIASHLTPANGPMTRLIAGVAQRYGAIPGSPDAGHLAALKTALAARLSRSIDPGLSPTRSARSCSPSSSPLCSFRCSAMLLPVQPRRRHRIDQRIVGGTRSGSSLHQKANEVLECGPGGCPVTATAFEHVC